MSSAVLFFGRICLSFSRYEWFVCVLHPEDYSSIFLVFQYHTRVGVLREGQQTQKIGLLWHLLL